MFLVTMFFFFQLMLLFLQLIMMWFLSLMMNMLLMKDPNLGVFVLIRLSWIMLIETIIEPTNMLRFGLKMFLLNDKSSKVMKLKH